MDIKNYNTKIENDLQCEDNKMKKNVYYKYGEIFIFIYFLIGIICLLFDEYFIKVNIIQSVYTLGALLYIYLLVPICISYLIFYCLLYKHRNKLLNVIDSILCLWAIMPVVFPIAIPILTSYLSLIINLPFVFDYDFFQVNNYIYYCNGLFFSFIPLLFCYIDKEKFKLFYLLKIITRILIIIFIILYMLGACDLDTSVHLN